MRRPTNRWCSECGGSGSIPPEGLLCFACEGSGRAAEWSARQTLGFIAITCGGFWLAVAATFLQGAST